MRYAKQITQYDCAITMMYNVKKWAGEKIHGDYKNFYHFHYDKIMFGMGMASDEMVDWLKKRNKYYRVVKTRGYLTARQIKKELEKGRSIVWVFAHNTPQGPTGHVCFLPEADEEYVRIINYAADAPNFYVATEQLQTYGDTAMSTYFVLEKK